MADYSGERLKALGGRDAPLLKEMRDRYDYARHEWQEIRDEGAIDMRAVAGNPWTDKDRRAREDANRPCLSLDELGQYVNQLINEVRQHKRAIQVTPKGFGANENTARIRAELIRQIEYESNAQQAYTTMFENTVQRSYGYLRIKPKYVDDRSFDQELLIEPIVNPDTVTIDPDAMKADGSDMRYAFVTETWTHQEFKRKFPKAKVRDFDPDMATEAPNWLKERTIQVGEYWTIETSKQTLLLMQPAQGQPVAVFEKELKQPEYAPLLESAQILKEREVDVAQVKQYLTNGLEILERHDWPGKFIPIVCCFGKVLWVDDGGGAKRRMLSLIRLARAPYMLYCYYRTCEAELVGMTPKFPYFAYEGQLSAIEQTNIEKSLHEPVALVKVRPTVDGLPATAGPLPFPQRQPYEPPIQALETGAEAARRAIQAAMGTMPLPTQGQRRNEKSGVALKEIEQSSQQGSYHFIDHYDEAITRTGAILDDLLEHYYDAARDVTVRSQADETRVVRINDPTTPDPETGQPAELTGRHDITLSTGPAYDSEREAASEFADLLAQNPNIFPIIGDLVVKLKNLGPIGDEIAERLAALLPPQVQALKQAKGLTPEMLMSQLQQAMQMIDALSKELNAKTQVIETDQVKAQQQVAIEQLKQQTDAAKLQLEAQKAQMDEGLKLRELEMKERIEMMKLGNAQMMARAEAEQELLHQHGDAMVAREERDAASQEASMDRQAERDEAEADRAFQADQGERERQTQAELAKQKASQSQGAQ